jgi:uncharacterized delta-60 repeat protein
LTTRIADYNEASDVAIQRNGKIVVAGRFSDVLEGDSLAVGRYRPNGSLDASFGNGGTIATDFGPYGGGAAYAVALQPDGKIVAAGEGGGVNGDPDFALARYLGDAFGPAHRRGAP